MSAELFPSSELWVSAGDRQRWATCTDEALCRECEIDRYRASGPGGQHRNKTESAVRFRHLRTGLSAIGEESRSQAENKARALRRIRATLILSTRVAVGEDAQVSVSLAQTLERGTGPLGERTRQQVPYWVAMAEMIDVFLVNRGEVAATARSLGISTGATSKFLLHDERVTREAAHIRAHFGLRPLR